MKIFYFLSKFPNIIAIILGILHVFCFAPFELYWLQPLILMSFYSLLKYNSTQKIIAPTFLFFISFFTFGLNWLSFSISMVSALPGIVVWLMIVLLAVFLASFYTLIPLTYRLLIGKIRIKKSPLMISSLTCYVLLFIGFFIAEYLRSIVLTGFPWLSFGYAQSVNIIFHPIFQTFGRFGVYVVGALTIIVSVFLVESIVFIKRYFYPFHFNIHKLLNNFVFFRDRNKSIKDNKDFILGFSTLTTVLMLITTVFIGSYFSPLKTSSIQQNNNKNHNYNQTSKIIVIQGNIEQNLKFDPTSLLSSIQTHLDLAEQALTKLEPLNATKPLIVFPETTIPIFWEQLPQTLQKRWLKLSEKADLLVGIVTQGIYQMDKTPEQQHIDIPQWNVHHSMPIGTQESLIYANSVVHLGHNDFLYHKKHLVPFGETLPMWLEGILKWINFPLPHFYHPTQSPLFNWNGVKIAVNICYENLFADEWEKFTTHQFDKQQFDKQNPNFFINVHNLGWFGNDAHHWRSFAQAQYSQITQVRSIEFQKPVIQVGNVGQTMLFLPNGQRQLLVPSNTKGFNYIPLSFFL